MVVVRLWLRYYCIVVRRAEEACYFTDLSQWYRRAKYGTVSKNHNNFFLYISNLVGLCYGLLSSHRRLDHRDDDFFIWHIVNRPEDIPVGVWPCL